MVVRIRTAAVIAALCLVLFLCFGRIIANIHPRTSLVYAAQTESETHERWALLIGINTYKNSRTAGFSNLRGCVNDVKDMEELLATMFEFPNDGEHIVTLTEENATHQGILNAIQKQLVDRAKPGDTVVLYYSGHGSEMDDDTRLNKVVQTIVPYDSRDPRGKVFDITGKELSDLLGQLKTKNATFLFDSCHSGTLFDTRGFHAAAGRVRSIPKDRRKRPRAADTGVTDTGEKAVDLRPPASNYAFLAGSASGESSHERDFGGRPRGALTFFLTQEIRRLGKSVTYRDIMDNVSALVTSTYSDQHPQLQGPSADQYVFGEASSVAQHYVLVSPSGKVVSVDAGQVQGLTGGSLYDVYKPRTKRFELPEQPIATVRLTQVGDFTSQAQPTSGMVKEVQSRAVERQHRYENLSVRVFYDGLDVSKNLRNIKAQLDPLTHIKPVTKAGQDFDLHILEKDGKILILGADPNQLAPPIPVTEEASVQHAVEQVQHWTKWINLLSLSNAQTKFDVPFTIRPLPRNNADPSGNVISDVTYYDDADVECSVLNNTDQDLYIAILDFFADGSIAQIYPAIDRPPPLYARQQFRRAFHIEKLPEGWVSGRNILKLFVSSQQRDFRIFELDAVRDAGRRSSFNDPLGQLFMQAGFGDQRAGVERALPLSDWATAQRVFVTRKR